MLQGFAARSFIVEDIHSDINLEHPTREENNKEFKIYDATVAKTSLKLAYLFRHCQFV